MKIGNMMAVMVLTMSVTASSVPCYAGWGDVIREAADEAGAALAEASEQAANAADEAQAAWEDAKVQASDFWDTTLSQVESITGESLDDTLSRVESVLGVDLEDTLSMVENVVGTTVEEAMATLDQILGDSKEQLIVLGDEVTAFVEEHKEGASKQAQEALDLLEEKGAELEEIIRQAVDNLKLDDEKSWSGAEKVVYKAIDEAYESGRLGKVDARTMQVASRLAFAMFKYGYQYSEGDIGLAEYVKAVSGLILKEGVPTGVAYLAAKMPIPGANAIARNATLYIEGKILGETDSEAENIAEQLGVSV